MSADPPLTRRPLRHLELALPAAVLGLAVLAACGDDTDRAETTADAVDSRSSGADDTAGDDEDTAGDDQDSGTDEDSGTDLQPVETERPRDETLGIEMRHPVGVTIWVDSVAFEGDDILLDVEVVNSSLGDFQLHDGRPEPPAYAYNRLRLVGWDGREYPLIEPEEELDGDQIVVAAGESMAGTVVFRGPLVDRPRPEQLHLVKGVANDEIEGFDIDDQSADETPDGDYGFVIPFDLTWD